MSFWEERQEELRTLLATEDISNFPDWKPICDTVRYGRWNHERNFHLVPDVIKMDRIFEFGPGYGGLCDVIYRAGFKGSYYLQDLPEMQQIQRYFLKADTTDRKLFWQVPTEKVDLFISTWALSEVPLAIRYAILRAVPSKNYFFIFQDKWDEDDDRTIDNVKFFEEVFGDKIPPSPDNGHQYVLVVNGKDS